MKTETKTIKMTEFETQEPEEGRLCTIRVLEIDYPASDDYPGHTVHEVWSREAVIVEWGDANSGPKGGLDAGPWAFEWIEMGEMPSSWTDFASMERQVLAYRVLQRWLFRVVDLKG